MQGARRRWSCTFLNDGSQGVRLANLRSSSRQLQTGRRCESVAITPPTTDTDVRKCLGNPEPTSGNAQYAATI